MTPDAEEAETETSTEEAETEEIEAEETDVETQSLADRVREDLLEIVTSLARGAPGDALDALDDLETVAEEAGELASTVDADDLPDAIDISEIPDAINVDAIARAVVSGEGGDAIDTSELLDVIELGDLWDAVDVREFWRNANELEAAIEEALGEEALTEWKEYIGETVDDAGGDDAVDVEWSSLADAADSDALQTAIQTQMSDAVAEFREGVLDARKQLLERRAELDEKTGGVGQPDSRNPTAFSTMAASRADIGNAGKFSTVPAETRHSEAPNHERIYGDRFEDPDVDEENDDA